MSEVNEEKVVQAVENVAEGKDEFSPEVTLSNGARVLCKALPNSMLSRIWTQFPEPKPPMVEIESGGKRWKEPNPDDPEYIAALRERTLNISEAVQRLTLLRGVEVVGLPEDIKPFEEDDDWLEELAWLGVVVPTSPAARYVEWLRYRVITTADDYEKIQSMCNRLSGVTEEDIAEAEKLFPDLRGRRAAG